MRGYIWRIFFFLEHFYFRQIWPPGYQNIAQTKVSPYLSKNLIICVRKFAWHFIDNIHFYVLGKWTKLFLNKRIYILCIDKPTYWMQYPPWSEFTFFSRWENKPILPHLQFSFYALRTFWAQLCTLYWHFGSLSGREIKPYTCVLFGCPRQGATGLMSCLQTHTCQAHGRAHTLVGSLARGIGELMMNGCEGFVIAQAPLWDCTMQEDTSLAQESNG